MKIILILILSVFSFSSTGFAQSSSDEIREMLESRDNEIKELLGPSGTDYTQEQRDQLKDIINDVIHYKTMAQFALGSTYDELSEETRDEFISLFSTIIRDNSLNRLDIYRADVVYNNIEVKGDSAFVETSAQLDNVRTPVDYKMELIDGTWMITDMTIDDVSTAESYNRQFQSIIRQRGFDALLESLRRRAARA
ncbi:MAG: ABC transporter substrate-binding protein [Balneolaceae bacterium]|nr:ABC transporter substrate-binding protein [Balneolaceae bacterium]